MEERKERARKAATELMQFLNSATSMDRAVFLETCEAEHRALQEEMTNLCVDWLFVCARSTYRFDARNTYSAKIGRLLYTALNKPKDVVSLIERNYDIPT